MNQPDYLKCMTHKLGEEITTYWFGNDIIARAGEIRIKEVKEGVFRVEQDLYLFKND